MKNITFFKSFGDKLNPILIELDTVLQWIGNCRIQKQIDEIRACKDKAHKRFLKEQLPCIVFSGTFSERRDEKMIKHSGFAILDFDKIKDVDAKKIELISYPFVYSVFVSPSGNGLKALVRIPADIKKHRGYYAGLINKFPDLDTANCNESRICFESCDSNIYINKNAIEFTDYVEQAPPQEPKEARSFELTDYKKIGIVSDIIRGAMKGDFHNQLVKASYLMGGYVAGGYVAEHDAIRILEDEIQRKPIEDFKHAQRTIRDCLEDGKSMPIVDDLPIIKIPTRLPSKVITPKLEFLSTDTDTDNYINTHRNGTFKMGLSTGWPELDKYFRFKPEHLVMILGHDNVGKSTLIWFLACVSAFIHGWKWIIFTGENRTGFVKKKLMEYYIGKPVSKMTDEEFYSSKRWVNDHFSIIKNEDVYNYADMLSMAKELLKHKKYNAFLIDPYNALFKKTTNEHQYDYAAMLEFRVFIKQTGCSIYLNMHAVTEALRRLYPKEHEYWGYPMPPNKADAEGGGKFSNKADDFLVFHRMTSHPSEWMYTQVHVSKIKESESGGSPTFKDQPFKLTLSKGACGFEDEEGFNPILSKRNEPKVDPDKFIEPNKDFDNEFLKPITGEMPF